MNTRLLGVAAVAGIVAVAGCVSAATHRQSLPSTGERDVTVGIVQKEIRLGMPQADVAEALGSPNIVTRDSTDRETWIYDKIATEVSYSRGSGGVGIIGLLVGGSGFVGGGGAAMQEAGASSMTQRTLTVVIRFDENGLVESTRYHATKF